MTIDRRKTGWLTERFHHRFREILLHTLARQRLICPVYCLMPDHLHLLWMGLSGESDQRIAARFFRTHLNAALSPMRLQHQAYDHALRPAERSGEAFVSLSAYILQNPVRAGLCRVWDDYPYLGSLALGYPNLHAREPEFWDTFWRIFNRQVEADVSMR